MNQFKVGDICDFLGMEVEVVDVDKSRLYPVEVKSVKNELTKFCFSRDGREYQNHPVVLIKKQPETKPQESREVVELLREIRDLIRGL
jgi:hypothetical protein